MHRNHFQILLSISLILTGFHSSAHAGGRQSKSNKTQQQPVTEIAEEVAVDCKGLESEVIKPELKLTKDIKSRIKRCLSHRNSDHQTLLRLAAKSGAPNTVQFFLSEGDDVS